MAKKKKISHISEEKKADILRLITLLVGSTLTVLVLTFSTLTLLSLQNKDLATATYYLVFVFISLGLTRFISYFKDRSRISLMRAIILMVFDITLGLIVIFAKYDLYVFSLVGGLYGISIIVSRAFRLVQKHNTRDIVFNVIMILGAILLAVALFQRVEDKDIAAIVLIECLVIAITAFIEVAVTAFYQLRVKVLFRIIFKTYALEILFGLLTLMVAFSLVLMIYEPEMSYFPDALWFCFSVVTTIGFGDIKAVTHVGRIITVILGMYGIVVVAVITSIIVNFYNETKGKDDIEQMNQIEDQENKKKKKK